jgi:hypothetical protein
MATPTTETQDVGETVQSFTIKADEIRQDPNDGAEPDVSMEQQLAEFAGEGEPTAAQPATPDAPAAEPVPKTAQLPDEAPKAEPDEPEPAEKTAATEKPAVEPIKPHTEFADARSLRPAYEALRVRAEAAEKAVADKDARIADLTRQIEETKPIKEEAEQLRAKVHNRNFEETEPYQQTITPLRTEAQSILARAGELSLSDGKQNQDKINDTIRRMVSLPDRGQRRQLASEVFDEADVSEAVALAGQLADVDRRYRATYQEWSAKASENLKLFRTKEVTILREEAEAVRKEQDARLGFVAKDPVLAEHRQEGEKLAAALLQLDELPARERRAVIREAYWQVARFPAMWAASYQALEQLKIARAALKRRGITLQAAVPGGAPGGGNGSRKKSDDMTLTDELDAEFKTLT